MFNLRMKNDLSFFIGFRYLRRSRDEKFISFISALSIAAMALGVSTLVIVLSIMNGFDREIKNRLLQIIPHISAEHTSGIAIQEINELKSQLIRDENAIKVDPMVNSNGLIYKNDLQLGVSIQGTEKDWNSFSILANHMIAGNIDLLTAESYQIVLGSQIARQMNLFIGDEVSLALSSIIRSPFGPIPQIKRFEVAGIFEVGAQVDGNVVFVNQTDIRRLLRKDSSFQGLHIYLEDPIASTEKFFTNIEENYPDLRWTSWQSEMTALFKAMKMEKIAVTLLLSVIIAIASFNIIASLVLSVNEKRQEIAVLRTMGATSDLIIKVFVIQGTLGSFFGIILGLFVGIICSVFITELVQLVEYIFDMQVFDPNIYLISSFPSQIVFSDIILITFGTVLVTILATIFPARAAGMVLPAEALRYGE